MASAPRTYADLAPSVFADIIAPSFLAEVRNTVASRWRWRKIANWAEGTAHALLGFGTILAYAAGFFDNKYLSFAAGCCGTACFVLLRYAVYANRESIERNGILGRHLIASGLEPPPSIVGDESEAPALGSAAAAALPAALPAATAAATATAAASALPAAQPQAASAAVAAAALPAAAAASAAAQPQAAAAAVQPQAATAASASAQPD